MIDVQHIDESRAGPAPEPQNFKGRVRMQNLAKEGGATKLELLAVHFDPGAHTRPHTHPSEQVLFVVPGGVVHMHGATEDEPICHVALRAADGPTDWAPADVPDDWRDLLA
jgi:quercetin dioxygenase-like cupin family protein